MNKRLAVLASVGLMALSVSAHDHGQSSVKRQATIEQPQYGQSACESAAFWKQQSMSQYQDTVALHTVWIEAVRNTDNLTVKVHAWMYTTERMIAWVNEGETLYASLTEFESDYEAIFGL